MELTYNQRQYKQMHYALGRYESGEMYLGSLITTLEALFECLEDAPKDWFDSFESELSVLEQANAIASARSINQIQDESDAFIAASIANLRKLIRIAEEKR